MVPIQTASFANLHACCTTKKPASPSKQQHQLALCATCTKLLAAQNPSTPLKMSNSGKLTQTGPLVKHPRDSPFSYRPSPPDVIHPKTFISCINLPSSQQRHQGPARSATFPEAFLRKAPKSSWGCWAGTALSSFRHILS